MPTIRFSLFALVLPFIWLVFLAYAEVQDRDEPSSWRTSLYNGNVAYEDFACKAANAETVRTFFDEHPLLTPRLPICHNDCPVVRCRPVIPTPPLATAAHITGTVSVHVLVNEEGKTLYARILDGHPLLWVAARKAACETQFNPYPDHKRQGVMHIYFDDTGFLGIPYTANEVH